MDTGLFFNVPLRDYLAAPAVNAHLARTMVDRCPAAAFHESWLNPAGPAVESSPKMDAGSIAHALVLEGGCNRVEVIDPMDFPAKTSGAIPEGWTNKDIRAARDAAYAAGKLPVLKAAMAEIEAMAQAARAYIATLERDEPAIYEAFQPDGGNSEVSMFWTDATGVPCRIRADRLARNRKLIVDYKTGEGTAEPNAWGRTQMVRMGYYMAAAFYRRGVKALLGTEPAYVFLVQENTPPYLCSLVGVDPQSFAVGGAKVEHALTLWARCQRTNEWPAYPTRVLYPELPPWEAARWEEMEALSLPDYAPRDVGAKHPGGVWPA